MRGSKTIRVNEGRRKRLVLVFKMSVIVGSILNCINHGECLWNGNYDEINWVKLLITFSVPFFVSLYSSAKFTAEVS